MCRITRFVEAQYEGEQMAGVDYLCEPLLADATIARRDADD
jgi:hypothetical protein